MHHKPVLCLDTACGAVSVAVAIPGKLLAWRREKGVGVQAKRLISMTGEALAEANLAFSDLSRIVVTVGPGSFTGVRIGLAAALGFKIAADLPVEGVTTLTALGFYALQEDSTAQHVLVLLTAGKGDVYAQRFSRLPQFHAMHEPQVMKPEEALALQADRLIGNALHLLPTQPETAISLEPDARMLAALAFAPGYIPLPAEPLYIRPPDAVPMRKAEGG